MLTFGINSIAIIGEVGERGGLLGPCSSILCLTGPVALIGPVCLVV